ncbi:MAG TPA: hypothetical protein VF791_24355 [Pyrinomonadaceae bacterium]
MEERKKSKYDTNPLDPDFERDARESRRARPVAEPEERWDAEAPTKRYDSSIPVSYPSINVPPSYPPRRVGATAEMTPATSAPSSTRVVPGLGLPENITYALPYAPFFIGAIAGAAELFLTPRKEAEARFHAAQGLVLQLAALAISLIFNIIGGITGSSIGGKLFWAASTTFFIIALVRVLKGESLHIAATDEAADWLNQRIEPKKKK